MTNVVKLVQSEPEDIEDVINRAHSQDLENVLIIGWAKDGRLIIESSLNNTAEANLMLDLVKHTLISNAIVTP